MTRTVFPMEVTDLSAFAKSLRAQIAGLNHVPSHVEMLNLLCKAAGYRNYQHFRAARSADAAAADSTQRHAAVLSPQPAADEGRVLKTLRLFDVHGRLLRWPSKRAQQELCLWFLWSKIPPARSYSEREISEFLNGLHLFGDPARLRRDMFDLGMVRRNRDGSDYRRIERKPPAELIALLRHLDDGGRKAA